MTALALYGDAKAGRRGNVGDDADMGPGELRQQSDLARPEGAHLQHRDFVVGGKLEQSDGQCGLGVKASWIF